MAWVQRVRTASGSTAVQLAVPVAGRRRIVRHVGSARDEAEPGLMEEARRLLEDGRQGVLDLGSLRRPGGPRWSRPRDSRRCPAAGRHLGPDRSPARGVLDA